MCLPCSRLASWVPLLPYLPVKDSTLSPSQSRAHRWKLNGCSALDERYSWKAPICANTLIHFHLLNRLYELLLAVWVLSTVLQSTTVLQLYDIRDLFTVVSTFRKITRWEVSGAWLLCPSWFKWFPVYLTLSARLVLHTFITRNELQAWHVPVLFRAGRLQMNSVQKKSRIAVPLLGFFCLIADYPLQLLPQAPF